MSENLALHMLPSQINFDRTLPVKQAVVFLHSLQPPIDRSWNPTAAARALEAMGFMVSNRRADSEEELLNLMTDLSNRIVWPTAYTLGPSPNGKLFVDILEREKIHYIGWPASTLDLNSKIRMKARLHDSNVLTPAYMIPGEDNEASIMPFPFPVVVKAEYSATSTGVAVAHDSRAASEFVRRNSERFGQRSLIEEWRRKGNSQLQLWA